MNRHAQRERRRVSDARRCRGAMRQPRPLQGIGDLLEFRRSASVFNMFLWRAVQRFNVPGSSSPTSREYPTTSANTITAG
jgi:hypothetical protein